MQFVTKALHLNRESGMNWCLQQINLHPEKSKLSTVLRNLLTSTKIHFPEICTRLFPKPGCIDVCSEQHMENILCVKPHRRTSGVTVVQSVFTLKLNGVSKTAHLVGNLCLYTHEKQRTWFSMQTAAHWRTGAD